MIFLLQKMWSFVHPEVPQVTYTNFGEHWILKAFTLNMVIRVWDTKYLVGLEQRWLAQTVRSM